MKLPQQDEVPALRHWHPVLLSSRLRKKPRLVRVLGKRPEHIHVVIQEVAEEDWGFEGLLTDEWKRRQRG